MPEATCRRCHEITEHEHLHDAAHGLPGTHMAGTERFVCTKCGLTTHAGDNEGAFTFVLDKHP
jgi:hypothetical protein